MNRVFAVGDVVQHFKRQWASEKTTKYLYRIIAFAEHTETSEDIVVYEAMYPPFKVCARPKEMFLSPVDRSKYPDAKQEYRFIKWEIEK